MESKSTQMNRAKESKIDSFLVLKPPAGMAVNPILKQKIDDSQSGRTAACAANLSGRDLLGTPTQFKASRRKREFSQVFQRKILELESSNAWYGFQDARSKQTIPISEADVSSMVNKMIDNRVQLVYSTP